VGKKFAKITLVKADALTNQKRPTSSHRAEKRSSKGSKGKKPKREEINITLQEAGSDPSGPQQITPVKSLGEGRKGIMGSGDKRKEEVIPADRP